MYKCEDFWHRVFQLDAIKFLLKRNGKQTKRNSEMSDSETLCKSVWMYV